MFFLAYQLIGNSGKMKGLKLIHANKNNDKNIENLFYKNALKSWRKLNAVFRPGKIQDIQRDWIYDNNLLMDENGNTFKCPLVVLLMPPNISVICLLLITQGNIRVFSEILSLK